MNGWIWDDAWEWLNTCRSQECKQATGVPVGSQPQYGSGETDFEVYGGPGGSPGDFGGETNTPIDPITGEVIPKPKRTDLAGIGIGTIVWIGFAVIVANAAFGYHGGGKRRR